MSTREKHTPAQKQTPDIFQQLQFAIATGTAQTLFPTGTILTDNWTNPENQKAYTMPHIIAHYGEARFVNGDKRFGAFLLRQNALPGQRPLDDVEYSDGTIHLGEKVHRWLNDEQNGYLAGCSAELKRAMADIIIYPLSFYCPSPMRRVKVFLPTLENLHFDQGDNKPIAAEPAWDYFRDTPTALNEPCEKRAVCDPLGIARTCWTRSVRRGFAYVVWTVAADGSARHCRANAINASTPACFITDKQPD